MAKRARIWAGFLAWWWASLASMAWANDFQRHLKRGTQLLDSKRYTAAILELQKAVTLKPKHFAARFYLALSFYQSGKMGQSLGALKGALALAQGQDTHRTAAKFLQKKIRDRFARLQITPQVDPDTIGRLRLDLRHKGSFQYADQRSVYRVLRKRWRTQGIALRGEDVYLPKGKYFLNIQRPQCLSLALVRKGVLHTQFELQAPLALSLVARSSCACLHGQILRRVQKKARCVCPTGTLWSRKSNRCIRFQGRKASLAWLWVSLAGVAVLAGGGVALYFLVLEPQIQNDPAGFQGRLWKGGP